MPTSWGTRLGQPHAIFGPPQRNQPRPAMLELFGVGCPVDQIKVSDTPICLWALMLWILVPKEQRIQR